MDKKPRENRVPIMMSESELKAIDDWRFENRIATRSDAVRRLCQLGLHVAADIPRGLELAIAASESAVALKSAVAPNDIPGRQKEIEAQLAVTKATHASLVFMSEKILLFSEIVTNDDIDTLAESAQKALQDFKNVREAKKAKSD